MSYSVFDPVLVQGFLVSGGLIVAIGAQNAYVLKQGLLKNHVFWVVLTCFLCDFILISIGVLGMGSLIAQSVMATIALALVGALFLTVYGFRALMSAFRGNSALSIDASPKATTLVSTIGTTLALTLLNPHVYLDTVVIIGGVASTLSPDGRWLFLAGALLASASWFFGLGYGARLLIPLFKKPITWRILDALIALIMWLIAVNLAIYAHRLYFG